MILAKLGWPCFTIVYTESGKLLMFAGTNNQDWVELFFLPMPYLAITGSKNEHTIESGRDWTTLLVTLKSLYTFFRTHFYQWQSVLPKRSNYPQFSFGPWEGFLGWPSTLQGLTTLPSMLLPELQRNKDNFRCEKWEGRTLCWWPDLAIPSGTCGQPPHIRKPPPLWRCSRSRRKCRPRPQGLLLSK